MSSPDLSLPSKSPTESHHHENHSCDKIAIYTLVDLGGNGIDALIKVLQNNDETPEDVACPPPKYNFSGGSLRNVYDYHLALETNERSLHPTLLVVAHHEDYRTKGVLLVNLDTDRQCSVDICRVKASVAILVAVNQMISNTGWEEEKEDGLPVPSFDDDNTEAGDDSSRRKVRPDPPSTPPYSIFGVYTIAGADMTDIRALLEPDWRGKHPEALCESVGSYTNASDPWDELIKHHPWNCRRNPRLHRQFFICADRRDPQEGGVLLVHMNWDGNITRDPDELLRIGLNVVVSTERCPVENAVATLQTRTS